MCWKEIESQYIFLCLSRKNNTQFIFYFKPKKPAMIDAIFWLGVGLICVEVVIFLLWFHFYHKKSAPISVVQKWFFACVLVAGFLLIIIGAVL